MDAPSSLAGKAIPFAVPASRWDDGAARGKSEAELLLYRSNLLGSDLTVTNFGGGNTSAKICETDPLTGDQAQVLWVRRCLRSPAVVGRRGGNGELVVGRNVAAGDGERAAPAPLGGHAERLGRLWLLAKLAPAGKFDLA